MADACECIDSHLDRILLKFNTFSTTFDSSLDSLLEHISTVKRELLSGLDVDPESDLSVMAIMLWEKALDQLRKVSSQMLLEHREMHCSISKCGKEIDKHFVSNYNGVCQKLQDYEKNTTLKPHVSALIIQHLLTHGLFEIAERFAEECDTTLDGDSKELYLQIHTVLRALKQKNLDPALEWCHLHSEKLQLIGSVLEFNLHKLKFVELMNRGIVEQMDTLAYAHIFQEFADKHSTDIQSLMGAMLYIPRGLEESPYKSLQDPNLWVQLCELFTRDACTLLGLPLKSPLSVILNAGATALPALLNIRQIMQQRQVMNMWSHNDELPIEIDLGNENRYHSVFSCPILRQQTTDKNPPMRLSCGHAISKEALHKLASNNKLKCPYCPQESAVSDAKQLYF